MEQEAESTKETVGQGDTKSATPKQQSAEDKLLAQMVSVSPTEHTIAPSKKGTKSLEELRGEKENPEKLGGPPVTFLDASGKPEKPRKKSAIRTYYDDVAETLRTEQTSIADIAIAENKRKFRAGGAPKEPKQKTTHTKSRVLTILGILVLVLAGAGALGYAYIYFVESRVVPPEPVFLDALLPADDQETLLVAGASRGDVLGRLDELLNEADGTIGNVVDVRLAKQVPGPTDALVPERISAQDALNLFDTHIDAALFRSIEDDYMLGLHLFDQPHYFLLLKTSFFENAFAGMLRWEKFIKDDLPFLATKPTVAPEPVGTTTAVVLEAEPRFIDKIIENRDVRVLVDGDEEILMYTFPDRDTLIITDNRKTLAEVLELMTVRRFSQ